MARGICSDIPGFVRTPICTPSATSSSRGATRMPSPSADKILAYLRETVAENGIDAKIRFHHKVLGAAWSSDDARWTVDVERFDAAEDTEELVQFSANWIFCAGGYYRYDQGFTPEFPGRDRFRGQIVHPQHWPEDLDYTGKKVVVIGSGATAVTLVPAMAGTAAHVTMLQRSPTYVLPVPSKDTFANVAQKVLGAKRGYALARRKNIFKQRAVYQFSQKYPGAARRLIRHLNAKELPDGLSRRRALQPDLQPVGSAAVRGARWRPVQGDQQRCRLGRHRPHRDLHRDRHPAGVRQAPRRRHHRHRNRFEPPVARRDVPDRGRRAGGRRRHRRLQGHDAVGRAELRVRLRLHELVVDAEGRPAVRALLPPAEPHGHAGLRHRASRGRRPRHARPGRCWTSPPDTSSVRWTGCRSRARGSRGGCR